MNRCRRIFSACLAGALPAIALARPAGPAIPFRQGADDALPAGGWYLLAFLAAALLASLGFAWLRRRPAGARSGAALAAWLKRPGQAAGAIEVSDSVRLDPRTNLFAVKWHHQELLIAAGDSGVTVLASQPAQASAAAGSAA